MLPREQHDRECLMFGVSSRGPYAQPGDGVWEWRLVHERAERDSDWAWLERRRKRGLVLLWLHWALLFVAAGLFVAAWR